MKNLFKQILITLLLLLANTGIYSQQATTRGGTIVGPGGPTDPQKEWTVLLNCGEHGTIAPAGTNKQVVVKNSENQSFTITADNGYRITSVKVDEAEQLKASETNLTTYTLLLTQEGKTSRTLSATFERNLYTLTGTAGTGGSISPTSAQIAKGGSQLFTITPDEGFTIEEVKVNGKTTGSISSYLYSNVTQDGEVVATFKGKEYTITINTPTNGQLTVTPLGKVPHGTLLTLVATPAIGYELDQITGNGLTLSSNTYRVTSPVEFKATFKQKIHTVTVQSPPNGTLTVKQGNTRLLTGNHLIPDGTELILETIPQIGYTFKAYTGGTVSNNKITVVSDLTLGANFEAQSYAVTVKTPETGTLTVIKADGTPVTGTTNLSYGNVLTLSNVPGTKQQFKSYTVTPSGALSGNQVTITAATTIDATFQSSSDPGTDPGSGKALYTISFQSPLQVMNGTTPLKNGDKVAEDSDLILWVADTQTKTVSSITANGNKLTYTSSGGVHTATHSVTQNTSFETGFISKTYPVTMETPTGGTLSVKANSSTLISGNLYPYGTTLTVEATAAEGYILSSIAANSDDITLAKNSTVKGTTAIRALFSKKGEITPLPEPSDPDNPNPVPDPAHPIRIDLTQQTVVYNRKTQSFVVRTTPEGIIDKIAISYQQNGIAVSAPTQAGYYDVILSRPADQAFTALHQTIPGGLYIQQAPVEISRINVTQQQNNGNTVATLIGGEAAYLETTVRGTYKWVSAPEKSDLTRTTSAFETIRFYPTDIVNYKEATADIFIEVKSDDPAQPKPLAHTVTVQTEGNGSVLLYNGSQPYPASGPFYHGINLTLKATPVDGYYFEGFTINNISYGNTYTINVLQDLTVKAVFKPLQTISEVDLVITVPLNATYDGQAKLATITSPLSNWEITYLNKEGKPVVPRNAGTYQVKVSRAADDSYLAVNRTASFTIAKAATQITKVPVVEGSLPAGVPLSSSLLQGGEAKANGFSTLPGTFSWNDPNRLVTAATSTYQVTFTPADLTNFATSGTLVEVKTQSADQPILVSYTTPSYGTLTVKAADQILPSGSIVKVGTLIDVTAKAISRYKLTSLLIGNTDYTSLALNANGQVAVNIYTSCLITATFTFDQGSQPDPEPDPDPVPDPTPDPTPDPEPDPEPDPTPDTPHTIWVTKTGSGCISQGTTKVATGSNLTFGFTAAEKQQIVDIRVNGNSVGVVWEYKFNNIHSDATLEAVFAPMGLPVYTLQGIIQSKGGFVAPLRVRVAEGYSHRFLIYPEQSYRIQDVKIGENIKSLKSIGTSGSYTFTQVKADSVLVANFTTSAVHNEKIDKTKVGNIYTTGGALYVSSSRYPAHVNVYSFSGQLMLRKTISAPFSYNLLNAGLYLVQLNSSTGIISEKIAIENH